MFLLLKLSVDPVILTAYKFDGNVRKRPTARSSECTDKI